jgi:hypothetical protein
MRKGPQTRLDLPCRIERNVLKARRHELRTELVLELEKFGIERAPLGKEFPGVAKQSLMFIARHLFVIASAGELNI